MHSPHTFVATIYSVHGRWKTLHSRSRLTGTKRMENRERERERDVTWHDMTWHTKKNKCYSVTVLQCYNATMLHWSHEYMNTWIHPPPSFLPSFLPSSLCRPDPPQSPPIPFLPLVFYMLAPLVTTTWHGSKRETKDKERKGKEKK